MSATFDDLRDNIIGAIAAASSSIEAVSRYQDAQTEELNRLALDVSTLRDDVAALANRIESVTRVLHSRTDHLA